MAKLSASSLLVVFLALAAMATHSFASSVPVVSLLVDESQAGRKLAFIHEEIQVKAGPLTLAYPLWIPGEHGPTGPLQQFARLRIRAAGLPLAWTRDPEEISTIHVDIPANVNLVSVDFDALIENTVSDHQLLLAWNTVVLYPRGIDKTALMIQPSLELPAGWKQASSLQVTGQTGNRVNFRPLTLERLIDSPVLAGEFLRVFPLSSGWPAELDVTGDSQQAVDKADEAHATNLFTQLIDEDRAMFGFRHWRAMHLLVSQSEARNFDGLEHEDSPYSAVGDAGLSKKKQLEKFGWVLLAHEQSHSWDGKYRRPAELYSKPDYQGPEHASLLWVYEGLNQYIGLLLATRAGFNDAIYARDQLARELASLIVEPARATTPLVDTASENWVLRSAFSDGWNSLRRGQDYYNEGAFIWLRADTIIRENSQDRRSLDDFLRSFFGQRDTDSIVVPYRRDEVEAGLSEICPYDWHGFFEANIYRVNPKPPTEGLEAAGWRLVYNDQPNTEPFYSDLLPIEVFAEHSLGIAVEKDGTIFDVIFGSPAYHAGLGPHMKVLAVDGRVYSAEVLNDSIAHPANGKITLITQNFASVEIHQIQYAGGIRYPHLEKISLRHDYLSEILAPRRSKER